MKDRSVWQINAGPNLWLTVTAQEAVEYVSLGGRVRLA